ncbi:MAG: ATP-binding protein [Acidobacteriia bacterium]|nr:ATP-binding protein [Terriglobia bacterium]
MGVDLYKDDLGAVAADDLYAAIEEFTGVALAPENRAPEGYLLDFKQEWSDKSVKTVAAFANTFGGLLIVGVSEKNGRADQVIGVPVGPKQELKTSIASSIASNISPTPPYEIWNLAMPQEPSRQLCIIRVRKGTAIHLWTKKDECPVYVRNDSESRRADAAQLQGLLATRLRTRAARKPLNPPAGALFFVTRATEGSVENSRERSATFLEISIAPEAPLKVHLDLAIEEKVSSIIGGSYPEPVGSWPTLTTTHSRNWYQLTYLHKASDYEMHWAIDDRGGCHFCTQTRVFSPLGAERKEFWSLSDLMTNISSAIGVTHQFWRFVGYMGEGSMEAGIRVGALPLLSWYHPQLGENVYIPGFYTGNGAIRPAIPLSWSAMRLANEPVASWGKRESGAAEIEINFASRSGSRAEAVALATNQILRDLGYAAKLTDLKQCFQD